MSTEDDVAVLIAENLRTLRESRGLKQEEVATLMNERLGIRDGDVDEKKRKKGWYQSTLYKIENVPPQRKISFREGVLLADIYGVSAEVLLRPSGDDDERWAAITRSAAEVDEGIHDLYGSLSTAMHRSRVLARALKSVPLDSLPLDSDRVLVNSTPELIKAMEHLRDSIQKHGEVRAPAKRQGDAKEHNSENTKNVVDEHGVWRDYDLAEWTAWENGERDTMPDPIEY